MEVWWSVNHLLLEPVQNLFNNRETKHNTVICRLVVSFLSQFFHILRNFSSQPKLLSTTHRFGNILNFGANQFFNFVWKIFSGVATVGQYLFYSIGFNRFFGAFAVGDIGCCNVDSVRQSVRINQDMALNVWNFFAGVIAFFFGGIGVFYALGVNDAKIGLWSQCGTALPFRLQQSVMNWCIYNF